MILLVFLLLVVVLLRLTLFTLLFVSHDRVVLLFRSRSSLDRRLRYPYISSRSRIVIRRVFDVHFGTFHSLLQKLHGRQRGFSAVDRVVGFFVRCVVGGSRGGFYAFAFRFIFLRSRIVGGRGGFLFHV